MGKATTLQERIEIMEMAQAGKTDHEISQQLNRPLSTVRKWRRRGQHGGREALASKMGRPRRGAMSSYMSKLRDYLCQLRQSHPGWGAKTLHAQLCCDPIWQKQKIPSIASIARLLKQQGLSRRYEQHSELPSPVSTKVPEVHQVWEMDAKGYQQIANVGYVSLININDRASHVKVLSYPCLVGGTRWERHPNVEDYQCALRLAFSQWGLPQQLQVDHGSVFIDNQSKSPFPTRLHLWLLALGVDLRFGRVAQPRDQGMTERSHQLWE